MKKTVLLLLVFILAMATTAAANSALEGYAYIGEEQFPFKLVKGNDGYYTATNQSFTGASGSLTFDITTNIDPFISYGLTATTYTPGPVLFGLAIPAMPIGPYGTAAVTASISGGVTDTLGDGVSITPLFTEGIQLNLTDSANWGVGGAFASPGPPFVAGAYTYPADYFAGSFAGPHTLFGELIAFNLSGFADVASLTGYCAIAPAPIPGSLLLLASGFLGLALRGKRKRKS